MTDLSLLQQRLAEAETAYHKLMTGDKEVTVSVGGFGATTYNQMSVKKLSDYIFRLKNEIAKKQRGYKRGPLWMRF